MIMNIEKLLFAKEDLFSLSKSDFMMLLDFYLPDLVDISAINHNDLLWLLTLRIHSRPDSFMELHIKDLPLAMEKIDSDNWSRQIPKQRAGMSPADTEGGEQVRISKDEYIKNMNIRKCIPNNTYDLFFMSNKFTVSKKLVATYGIRCCSAIFFSYKGKNYGMHTIPGPFDETAFRYLDDNKIIPDIIYVIYGVEKNTPNIDSYVEEHNITLIKNDIYTYDMMTYLDHYNEEYFIGIDKNILYYIVNE